MQSRTKILRVDMAQVVDRQIDEVLENLLSAVPEGKKFMGLNIANLGQETRQPVLAITIIFG